MNRSKFESIVEEVKEQIITNLQVDIPFTIKIREVSNENWVAQYRGGTLTRSGRAIFWVNENFPQIVKDIESSIIVDESDLDYSVRRNLMDTLCHELIHAIQESVYFAKNNLLIGIDFNEEEAEEIGLKLSQGESISSYLLIQDFINLCTIED